MPSILELLGVDKKAAKKLQKRKQINKSRRRANMPDLDYVEKYTVAYSYYRDRGYNPKAISGHLAGIDFSKDVRVALLPKGTILQQSQVVWQRGNYFSIPGAVADTIGINPKGTRYIPTKTNTLKTTMEKEGRIIIGSEPVPRHEQAPIKQVTDRVLRLYMVREPVQILISTAAAIVDTWSVRGEAFPTKGGEVQLVCLDDNSHEKITPHHEALIEYDLDMNRDRSNLATTQPEPLPVCPAQVDEEYFSNFETAYSFYMMNGYSDKSISAHLARIDCTKKVEMKVLPKNTLLCALPGRDSQISCYYKDAVMVGSENSYDDTSLKYTESKEQVVVLSYTSQANDSQYFIPGVDQLRVVQNIEHGVKINFKKGD